MKFKLFYFSSIFLFVTNCKMRSDNTSAPQEAMKTPEIENSNENAPQDVGLFLAIEDENAYKKELTEYEAEVSSISNGGNWANFMMALGGYTCTRTLKLIYQEETTNKDGSNKTIAVSQNYDNSFFSSTNSIKTTFHKNSLRFNPSFFIYQRLYCSKDSDSIWVTWQHKYSDNANLPTTTEKPTEVNIKPEEKDMLWSLFTGGLKSNIIAYLTNYTFNIKLKYVKTQKFFDYTNCTEKSKTDPFYFHITQGFGSGTSTNSQYKMTVLVDGLKLPAGPESGSQTSSSQISSNSGYYALSFKYCPAIKKDFIRFRVFAKEEDTLSADELFLSQYRSLTLARGESAQYETVNKPLVGSDEKAYMKIEVYNQNMDLKPGQSIGDQIVPAQISDAIKIENLKQDILYSAATLQKEYLTCKDYPADEDLLSFIKETLEKSKFSADFDDEKIKEALKLAQEKSLSLTGVNNSIDLAVMVVGGIIYGTTAGTRLVGRKTLKGINTVAGSVGIKKPIEIKGDGLNVYSDAFGYHSMRDFGVGVTVLGGTAVGIWAAVNSLQKKAQAGDQAIMDRLEAFAAYTSCQSPQKTKEHFSETVSILGEER